MELMNVDRKKKKKENDYHLWSVPPFDERKSITCTQKGDISIGSPKLTVEKAKIESTNSWKESLHMVRFCARWSR